MLQVNAEARYTAQDVLSHPWVTVSHSTVCVNLLNVATLGCICDLYDKDSFGCAKPLYTLHIYVCM